MNALCDRDRLPVLRCAAVSLVLATAAAGPLEAGKASKWEWTGVGRVVVVGDVHGSNYKLTQLLQGAALIDENRAWIGKNAHLVVVGDIVDRQPHDRAVMDLLRRLEIEAAAAGGRAHVLLGNHEVMNLVRDLRYVSRGSYASFAKEEKPKERRDAARLYEKRGGDPASFDERYPPGYFARMDAFGETGEYGRWLLELPTIVKINGGLFVHGGMTEEIARMGLDGINRMIRDTLRKHLVSRQRLQARGILNDLMDFRELQDAAWKFMQRERVASGSASLLESAAHFLTLAEMPIFNVDGPLWYRGNSLESERLERERLSATLELLRADKLVVAHSPTRESTINTRFSGRLYRVDHGMSAGNAPLALIFENDQVHVLDPRTAELSAPERDRPQGEWHPGTPAGLSDAELEQLLTTAEIVAARDLGRGTTRPRLLDMRQGSHRLRAVFKTVDRHPSGAAGGELDRYQHEVAAYRVARMLGLDFVPVTVVRETDGIPGSLQEFVEGAVDQVALESYELQASDPEKMRLQLEQSRAFDLLIGNSDRGPTDLLYLLDENRLMCIDHSKAFPVSSQIGWSEDQTPPQIDPALRERMAELDAEALRLALGELLETRQIDALLARRDALLAAPAVAGRTGEGSP